ncbi:MAG TPA: single-stranded-DNA-specific exonuclease RecJ [Rhizomicrobium sp.]
MSEHALALDVGRSFSGRRWHFRATDPEAARVFGLEADVSQTLASLLLVRNVKSADVVDYLNPTLRRLLPEPFLLTDMEQAVARTARAITVGEMVAVFGDYDVDGSCSAALLYDFLAALGRPPLVYIPDRLTEGYGPNTRALLGLKEQGAGLVITVDCGAVADAALAAARAAGLATIVLDHHAVDCPGTAGLRPAAAGEAPAIPGIHVNPNRSDDRSGLGHLCAAGVAFLFAVALNRELRKAGWYTQNAIAEPDLRNSLDLVGLATVCDVAPLVGINRAFVRAAETRLSRLERAGIRALAAVARAEPPFSIYHCGFVLGPRINAGGRVGRCSLGVELLTAADDTAAQPLAQQLDLHNRERRAIEAIILAEAVAHAERQDNAPFVFAHGESWHQGVVGIVAGRLKERFHKPAFVVGFEGETGRGSARSVAGIDVGALIRAARDAGIVRGGGGHPMAAGFELARNEVDDFREWLRARLIGSDNLSETARSLWLDGIVAPAGATAGLVAEIERAGPFGAGNGEPVLVACDVRLAFAEVVGQGHVRLRLQGGDGAALSAIAFRAADTPLGRGLLEARGACIHAAGTLRAKRWNGRTEIQLQLEDAAAVA